MNDNHRDADLAFYRKNMEALREDQARFDAGMAPRGTSTNKGADMKWADFKKLLESKGVTDDTTIEYIDVSFTGGPTPEVVFDSKAKQVAVYD